MGKGVKGSKYQNVRIAIASISIIIAIFWSAFAFAQPNITGFSGSLTNGSTITINGNSFGANGPNIVVFDNFESGTNGSYIKTGAGSATIGQWDGIGGGTKPLASLPKYDNRFKVSGGMSFRGDATIQTNSNTTDAGSPAYANFTATSDIFVSYWYYMPSTSDWPCYNNGICNNKLVWVVNTCCNVDDRVIPANSSGNKTDTPNLYMFSNNSIGEPPLSPSLLMSKGKWYRFWVYLHGAGNATDHEELWVASPSGEASLAATRRINRTTQIFQTTFGGFKRIYINAYQRWCNDCAESAPTFDDVYVATGTGAQARVEIGDAATYATSKNLTIATVTSWSDTSITATIRQGSFSNLNNAYLYVIDADGNVNENGYLLSDDGGNTPPPPSSNTGNDASASGGSGCGFIKGKEQKAKGEGLVLMIIMMLTLTGITLVRRVCSRKIFVIFLLALLVGCGGGNVNSGGSGNNSGNGNNNSADTAPPSVPTGLLTQSVSTNQVSISWNASTDNNGVAGYRVYRNNAQVATAAGTSYQDANLLPSTTYSYKVAAYDAAGNISQQSAALNVTTQSEAAACSDNIFSFALFSDNYSGQEGGMRRALNEAVSKDPNIRFLASAGDTPPYERVRGIIDAELSDSLNCGASEFPWFPATGNHDSEAQSYMDWWAANWANGWTTDPAASRLATQLPGIHNFKRGPLQIQTASGLINADHGTMYSFDYKNAHFIYIDNYEQAIISDTSAGAWDQNGSSVFDPAVSQIDWLKDDLEQNTKPITFVFGHVALLAPCYNYEPPISYYDCPGPPPPSWSEHNSNFHTVELTKLLADYNVVAYFHGHDHVPSRMLINSNRTSAFERLYWAAANDPNKPYGTPSDWEGLQGPGRVWQVDGGAVYTNVGEYIIVKVNDAEIRFEIYRYPNNTQGSTELWDTWNVPIAPYCTANGGCL